MEGFKIRRTVVFAIIIVAASFGIFKYLSSLKEAPKKAPATAKVIKIDVIEVVKKDYIADVAINGRLVSKYKIDIFTEVTGRLLENGKSFKEGMRFNKGEVLLKLDDSNYRLNLIATRSSFHSLLTQLLAEIKIEYPKDFSVWENYINNFNPEQNILDLPSVDNSKAKNYLVSKGVYTQFFNIKAQEAQLDKYTIVAPFTGVVNKASINPNSIVRAGQKLAEFINPSIFELEVGVNLAEISKVSIGDKVNLSSSDIKGSWIGSISRISESIDEQTMTFKIYIEVKSKELYEGMYLKGVINSLEISNVVQVPSNLIVHTNYIFVVENDVLRKRQIQIVHESNGYVLISGLDEGEYILGHTVANAFDGMTVTIN